MAIKLDLFNTTEIKSNSKKRKNSDSVSLEEKSQKKADTISLEDNSLETAEKTTPTHEVHAAQYVHDAQEVQQDGNAPVGLEYGTTQGRKGMRLKRINITLGSNVKEHVNNASAVFGQSMTAYINGLIDDIRQVEASDSKKGIKQGTATKITGSRITMAFSDDNYEYLKVRSRVNGISVSRLLNQLIERELQR